MSTKTYVFDDDYFESAMDAAQYYLDWYVMRGLVADHIDVRLRPITIHVVTTCGESVLVDSCFAIVMTKVLHRESLLSKKTVEELQRISA